MGEYQDREFLMFDETIGNMHALSFMHSAGVLYVSPGRVLTQRQLILQQDATSGLALEKTINNLMRLATLGVVSHRSDDDDVDRFRLVEGHVTVLLRTDILCDVCKIVQQAGGGNTPHLAVADARTQTGRWGYVCPDHFVTEGCNLGMGKGQLIRPNAVGPRKLTYR